LLRALLRAEAFVRAQPEAARAIVARAINIPSRYLDRMPEMFHLRVALDHSLVSSMDGQVRWLAGRQGHIAPTRIDVSDHLAPEFLTTVKPAAVRLYRVEKSRP
jgi:ABC-type nitrate/sulfonate/bicarbonate transport system substrate-binding protein